jgi:hypothetical protein
MEDKKKNPTMQIPLEIKESGRKHVTDDKREEECTIRF